MGQRYAGDVQLRLLGHVWDIGGILPPPEALTISHIVVASDGVDQLGHREPLVRAVARIDAHVEMFKLVFPGARVRKLKLEHSTEELVGRFHKVLPSGSHGAIFELKCCFVYNIRVPVLLFDLVGAQGAYCLEQGLALLSKATLVHEELLNLHLLHGIEERG